MPFIAALLVFVGFFFLHPFIPFPPLPGPDPCAGVSSSIRGLCKQYCTVEDCDAFDRSRPVCNQLRYDLVRLTGRQFFPCDLVIPVGNTHTPTSPPEETPTSIPTDTPIATATGTTGEAATETPTETPTATFTPEDTATFTPIETSTATSTPEGLAAESAPALPRSIERRRLLAVGRAPGSGAR